MEEQTNSLISLVSPEFDILFDGKTYRVRKATLDKAVAWQQRVKELGNDASSNQRIIAFCLYIMLKDQITDLTEDYVMAHTPADIDAMKLMVQLGFLSSTNLEMINKAKAVMLGKLTTDNSSGQSQTKQDGLPAK